MKQLDVDVSPPANIITSMIDHVLHIRVGIEIFSHNVE